MGSAAVTCQRQRIVDAINASATASLGVPMQWGDDDCALWCGTMLAAGLDYDPCQDWRDQFSGEAFAALELFERSKGSLYVALSEVARRHGWQRIDPSDACPGDIALARTTNRSYACVIKLNSTYWVGRTNKGVSAIKDTMRVGKRTVAVAWGVC